jgi:hypothetical protein
VASRDEQHKERRSGTTSFDLPSYKKKCRN